MWNLFKVNNKNTRKTSTSLLLSGNIFLTFFWCFYCVSSVSINFEQVNAGWETYKFLEYLLILRAEEAQYVYSSKDTIKSYWFQSLLNCEKASENLRALTVLFHQVFIFSLQKNGDVWSGSLYIEILQLRAQFKTWMLKSCLLFAEGHKFQWPREGLNCEPPSCNAITQPYEPIGLGNSLPWTLDLYSGLYKIRNTAPTKLSVKKWSSKPKTYDYLRFQYWSTKMLF